MDLYKFMYPEKDAEGLGKVGLRLEFQNNDEMFQYIDANKQIQEFVKPPNSKNPRDPETQDRLKKIVATAKAAGDQDQVDDQETDSGVKLIPLDQIFTDHKNFQNRETDEVEFSEVKAKQNPE